MKRTILLFSMIVLVMLVPVTASAVGTISVTSTPAGAAIWMNGTATGQVTPATVSAPNGTHTIVVKLAGYHDSASQSVTVNYDAKTVSATLISAPVISGVSPVSGINNGPLAVTITGTTFLAPVTVTLTNGSTSIAGANTAVTAGTNIACSFNLNGAAPGTWNIVVLNTDSGTATLQNALTVISAASVSTVSSVTPASGAVNSSVAVTIAGTGFDVNAARMRLTRTGYNTILGSVSGITATQMTGTFDLTNQATGPYTVCVLYDGTNSVCGPAFTINSMTAVNGTVAFSSNPNHVGIYLNNVYKGTTPLTLDNITPGTYTIEYRLSGYDDLSKQYIVTAGQITDAYGYLNRAAVVTVTTPVYTVPTTVRKTATTVKRSTVKVPTPWPTATPTKSPVDLFVILGAVGFGFVVMRK
jgi:hypothetical protein